MGMMKDIMDGVKSRMDINVLLMSAVFFSNIVGFIPNIPPIALAAVFVFCIINMPWESVRRTDLLVLLFWLWLPLCTLLASPATVFKPWQRLALFSSAFILVSPLIQGEEQRRFRRNLLEICVGLCIVIGVVSFFCYFAGINFMKNRAGSFIRIEDYMGRGGLFSGITAHSMLLGPAAGVGALALTYLFCARKKIVYLVLSLFCYGSMLFAASRGAFVSTCAGLLALLYRYSGKKARFIKIVSAVVLVLALSFPLWKGAVSGLRAKQAWHNARVDVERFDSRTGKVEARWSEFKKSPVWGQGFAAIDENGKDYYNRTRGTLEPGSSWLFILSSTGAVGLLLFAMMFFCSVRNALSSKERIGHLWFALLALFAVHLLIEGYIFASGSPLCVIAWLVISCGYDTCQLEIEA